jgi:hypothetical protein
MNQEKFEAAYIRSNAQLAFVIAEAISGPGVFKAAKSRPGTETRTKTDDTETLRTKKGTIVTKVRVPGAVKGTGYGITSKSGKYRYLGSD